MCRRRLPSEERLDQSALTVPALPAALANPNNHGKLVTIVRKVDGTKEVLSNEQSTEFFSLMEGPVGQNVKAIQVRWGERAAAGAPKTPTRG